jgi:glycosyltransferase involved in cell wall biosynthesis
MTRAVPLVSIGLPVFNGEPYLRAAIDSLLAQTLTDLELIISDNASTDGTADICREYAARDARVRYVRNDTNIGLNRNCNQVIRMSVGQYFKLAASDDICHPDLVRRCVEVLNDDGTVVSAYAKTRFIDPDGNYLAVSDPGWHLMTDRPEARLQHVIASGHWVNLFFGLTRASTLAQTRLFAPYANGDYRLLGELCLRGKFYEVPDFLFFRRLHPEASSQNNNIAWQSEFFKTKRRQLPFWSLCFDHARTIVGSRLKGPQKIACIRVLGMRLVSGRRELLTELHLALKSFSR